MLYIIYVFLVILFQYFYIYIFPYSAKKSTFTGQIVTSFCAGLDPLYRMVHNNPFIKFCDMEYVNNPAVIAQNSNVTAVNGAIEVLHLKV